jgi:hypothetical protein
MFFNSAACPAGWSDLVAGQGRYLVGMPPSGTLGATIGTALGDEENRAVGQHSHSSSVSATGLSVSANTTGIAVSDQGHQHGVFTAGGSNPWYGLTTFGGTTTAGSNTDVAKAAIVVTDPGHGHAVSDPGHSHTISNAGSVAGTNAPYVQFRVCQKS